MLVLLPGIDYPPTLLHKVRLSGLQTRSRAALGFLKSRPEQVYVPANRPPTPLRTLNAGLVFAALGTNWLCLGLRAGFCPLRFR